MIGKVKSGSGLDSSRGWEELDLGYKAYPGTLNVLLERPLPPLEPEFYHYDFACTRGKINGTECHVCASEYLTRKMRVFIVSPVRLRDFSDLKDGDTVEITVKR